MIFDVVDIGMFGAERSSDGIFVSDTVRLNRRAQVAGAGTIRTADSASVGINSEIFAVVGQGADDVGIGKFPIASSVISRRESEKSIGEDVGFILKKLTNSFAAKMFDESAVVIDDLTAGHCADFAEDEFFSSEESGVVALSSGGIVGVIGDYVEIWGEGFRSGGKIGVVRVERGRS